MNRRAGHGSGDPPTRRDAAALTVLFLARVCVSFQFQSIAPLSALLDERFPVSLSGLGLLLGLYMAPGVLVALFLPALIARFRRAWIICLALTLMAGGEVLLWTSASFEWAAAARLVGGAGGCVIYILAINMVADLDTTVPAAARMGIIAAAWPFGNACAIGLLGWLVQVAPDSARHAPLALVLAAFLATGLLLLLDQSQAGAGRPSGALSAWGRALCGIWPAALSFALYNIGFIILTGFAGRILLEDGVDPSIASGIAGIPMWMFLLSVPLGGLIAGRSVAGDRRIVAFGCVAAAAALLASAGGSFHGLLYLVAGIVGGLPTAPILARGRDASPESADITYSALFFVFFASLLVVPPLAGRVADVAGTGHVVLAVSAALLLLSTVLFEVALRRIPSSLPSITGK